MERVGGDVWTKQTVNRWNRETESTRPACASCASNRMQGWNAPMEIETSRERSAVRANGESKRPETRGPGVLPPLHLRRSCTQKSRHASRCQASVGPCDQAMMEACARERLDQGSERQSR